MGGDQSVPVEHLQPTALVVEDHELSRKLLEVRLEIEGFATTPRIEQKPRSTSRGNSGQI